MDHKRTHHRNNFVHSWVNLGGHPVDKLTSLSRWLIKERPLYSLSHLFYRDTEAMRLQMCCGVFFNCKHPAMHLKHCYYYCAICSTRI